MTRYEIVEDSLSNKEAIKDIATGRIITGWHDIICLTGLYQRDSDYYSVRNNGREAIFHKENPDKPISNWHSRIFSYGLIAGQSDYYLVENNQGYQVLFHKNYPDKAISEPAILIGTDGLLEGESDYYIVVDMQHNKRKIYHKNDKEFVIITCRNTYDDAKQAYDLLVATDTISSRNSQIAMDMDLLAADVVLKQENGLRCS